MTKKNILDIPETSEVTSYSISCDGSKGVDKALGHPLVYLKIGDKGFIECPYCDHRFTIKAGTSHSHH